RDDIVLTEDEMSDSECFASIYDGKKIGIESDGAEKLLRKVNKAYAPSSTVALYDALKKLTMKPPVTMETFLEYVVNFKELIDATPDFGSDKEILKRFIGGLQPRRLQNRVRAEM
ncbi:hypothetical protein ADUPG1_003920, partial [Aduncisulcus paluster]